MIRKTEVCLWLLALINLTKGIWTVPNLGDTFRFSVDVINNAINYEKIGDLTGYYSVFGPNILSAQYGCGFDAPGELDFNVNPATLGLSETGTQLTFNGNNITSEGGYSIGAAVSTVNILSFTTKFLPSEPTNGICTGFWYNSNWYQLCINQVVSASFSPQNYSSCGVCDCACATCFGPKATQCNTCSTGYYQGGISTCSPCTTGCATCSGGGSTQCSSCFNGYYLSPSGCSQCTVQCAVCSGGSNTQCSSCNTNYYLQPSPASTTCLSSCPDGYYPDATTKSCHTCAIGCSTCTGGSNTQCPSCSNGFYLQPSTTTCLNYCPSGYYTESTTNTCLSCTTGCVSCESTVTCDNCATGYYFLPGKTACATICPSGLCTYAQNNACINCLFYCGNGERMPYEGCDDGNLINGDGCSSTCTIEQNWVCQGGSPTSKDTCTCANITGVYQFGNSCVTLDSSTRQSVAQVSSLTKSATATTQGGMIGIQMISGASGSMFATALNSLYTVMLFKFCDVGYPPNIEDLFLQLSNDSSSAGSFDFNVFVSLQNEYSQGGETQNRFNKFGVKAFFLSNMGTFFILMPIALILIVLLNILRIMFRTNAFRLIISKNLLPLFQWNQLLSLIIAAQTKFALACLLKFSNPVGNTYSIVNLVISIITLLSIIAVYCLIISKIGWNWRIVREKLFLSRQVLANAYIKQKALGILWESYDVKTSVGRYILILQLFKNTLVAVIIFALYAYPLAQCYSLIFLSIIYLLILGIGRPHKKIIDTVDNVMNEICFLLIEILMAVFATNKNNNFLDLNTGKLLGWVMLGIIFLCLGANILCIVAAIIQLAIERLRKSQKRRANILRMNRRMRGARQNRLKSPPKAIQGRNVLQP